MNDFWGQLPELAYLIAAVCFILSLGGLSRHETSRRGNFLGIMGMSLAVFATLLKLITLTSANWDEGEQAQTVIGLVLLGTALAGGATVGRRLARRVEMTAMPQLVALLHSFVGLAAVLVGFNSHIEMLGEHHLLATFDATDPSITVLPATFYVHQVEVFFGVFIGAITFTGSVVAWGKLNDVIRSRPYMLRGRHYLNLTAVLACIVLGWLFLLSTTSPWTYMLLIAAALIAFALGAHLVLAIGGADMPVVVSMLNSYSGWAAAATGFLLNNHLLIVTGALVGSSGAILSYIMCRAMNRSFFSVILGGFGNNAGGVAASGSQQPYQETSSEAVARELRDASQVVVVPGYGMAVAQAQNPVREVTELLQGQGTRVRFAIHPVAGRLPGHMNVLLAEANVAYDDVLEMDEINADFSNTDVVLIIGANDIVNPAAVDDPTSSIYRMPVLHVWEARRVVIIKRSMAAGYAGIDNPLFYRDNSRMLFGDAKACIEAILGELLRSEEKR